MSVVLSTICLNEMEWLPKLYEQHKDWPEMLRWIFVEAADRVYAETSPNRVNANGLSVDGTSQFLRDLSDKDQRIIYIPLGFTGHRNKALGKIEMKARALEAVGDLRPDFYIILDADEFYTRVDQDSLAPTMKLLGEHDGYVFRKREIWHPPSVAQEPILTYEAVGGFWDMQCCHWFTYRPGMRFQNCHNTPDWADGTPMRDKLYVDGRSGMPQMVHMGFAAQATNRIAKNLYYEQRGEITDPRRHWYTKSRASWLNWKPGDPLLHGEKVIKYDGPIPECFANG